MKRKEGQTTCCSPRSDDKDQRSRILLSSTKMGKRLFTLALLPWWWTAFFVVIFGNSGMVNANGGVNITVITALSNSSVNLPCDISLPNNHERVTLVLWYREDLGIPIYSIEVGENDDIFSSATVWSDEKWLGARARFRPETFPAILRVNNVRGSDSGQYRCRVDFTEAPTRNTIVNLTIIVPPDPLVIFDETGSRRTTFVGPYREKDNMILICDAFGGVPPPRVTWSRGGRLIDETFHVLANGTVRNEISFHAVDRSYLHAELTCTATNTNLTRPVTTTVHVDMNFSPVSVEISNKGDQMVVGRQSEIVCRSSGSRPPAHITWYLGGVRIEGGTESTSSDGNTTVSILSLWPKMEHINLELVCRASNPLIKETDKVDSMRLEINYAPRVELTLGKSISAASIYEGGDVYFDCFVKSRPPPTRILWQLNDGQLHHNTSDGVIFTNQSLVLQQIDRSRSGAYTCEAINAVGKGSSLPIFLDVKYVPVCQHKEPIVHGVGKGEMVDVICGVVANPSDLTFHWTFNNSADFINVPRGRAITVNNTTSKLTYTPRTNKDYGTLMCTASNEVGTQRHPCVFHIILAVAPDPPENCTVINKSSETFHLQCIPGFDGGMEQYFLVTVTDRTSGEVAYNQTTTKLDLLVQNLSAGSSYLATMTPFNKKGPGAPTHVLVDMLGHPAVELTQAEDAVGSGARADLATPAAVSGSEDILVLIVGIIAGCASCVTVLTVVCLLVRRRARTRRFSSTPTRLGDEPSSSSGGALATATTLSRTSGGKEVNITTSVVSKDNSMGNGSIIGTTASDYFGSPSQQLAASGGGTVRKGILKRNPVKGTTSGSNWEYELAPPPPPSSTIQVDISSESSPDIIPSLPLSIPPPPKRADDCEMCQTITPPPPPLLSSDGEEPFPRGRSVKQESSLKGEHNRLFMGSSTLPRRTSREGILCEGDDGADFSGSEFTSGSSGARGRTSRYTLAPCSSSTGDGSSDPLLQIPDELSAVLTLKRGVHLRSGKQQQQQQQQQQPEGKRTPLLQLKRKRESIV